ncbi:MAG: hypothetical protein P1P76_09840 [Anaerolineales bacterium]|nr:hypothetical protein [Anaerolineales bacterium]
MALEIGLYVLATGALIWAAYSDIKSRRIPVFAGFGLLGVGLIFLLVGRLWIQAAFFLLAIWGSRGKKWGVPVAALGAAVLFVDLSALPFVLGVLFVLFIFWMGWFGGGDAQLAMGLLAVGSGWWMVAYLFGGTILVAFVLSIIERGGVVPAMRRLFWVLKNIGEEPDQEALRIPWGVLAAVAGLAYMWIWPGGWRGVG